MQNKGGKAVGGFFKSKKFKIILCMLAFSVGMMLYTFTKGGYVFSGEALLNTVLNPVKKLANNITVSVEKGIERFTNTDNYYDENIELKKQIAQYQQLEADYNQTVEEFDELKAFMGIKEEHSDYVLSDPCHIIGYVTNDPFNSFYINKGENDNKDSEHKIEVYDPVVTSEGLVGIITEVADTYSVVTTILSDEISVSAVVSGTKDSGVVEGSMNVVGDGKTRMIHIDKEKCKSKAGNLVVTSSDSGIFPSGYLIGTIDSIGTSESGLTNYADITPSVDFDNLSTVMVILDFDGKGVTNEEK